MTNHKVGITETLFRDAHQSLIATRLKTEEMLPIASKIDRIGYHSVEMWGGATFDSCLRFLHEDPWERLRALRKAMPNTKLQMLLRGQNLLGYKHYPDDVVEKFIEKSIVNGIDIIRVFDALNDMRNLEISIKSIKKYKGHAQVALSYTTSPVHNFDYYIKIGKMAEKMGADSICIKDMSGILVPYEAFDLVSELKKNIQVPIQIHSHFTTGMANATYLKAVEAGADVIDTALSPFAMGTSQPATESLVASFQNTPYDTGLNLEALEEVAEYMRKIRDQYQQDGTLNAKSMEVNVKTLLYQVPGGMFSNLVSQLSAQNALDKLEKVLEEIPSVRKDMGYPPLVTPMSQMVGTQALFNVMTGEKYKLVPVEIKNYVKGLYGQPPVPIAEDIVKKIIGEDVVFQGRPADLLEPSLKKSFEEIKDWITKEEDILSYILFPQSAMEFFQYRFPDVQKERGVQPI